MKNKVHLRAKLVRKKRTIAGPNSYKRASARRNFVAASLFLGCLAGAIFAFTAIIVYAMAGIIAFEEMFYAENKCSQRFLQNNPRNFVIHDVPSACTGVFHPNMTAHFADYYLPSAIDEAEEDQHLEEIHFSSRFDPVHNAELAHAKLRGWLLHSQRGKSSTWVIVTHGYRTCRRDHAVLFAAAVLWKHGFNVAMLDLRNHGESPSISANLTTYGSTEHFDVLGLFDTLRQRYPAAKIGVLGQSLGGATAMIAFSREPRISCAFLDSPVCDVHDTLTYNAELLLGSKLAAQVLMSSVCTVALSKPSLKGCPPFTFSPLTVAKNDTTRRPVFFFHAIDDLVVPQHVSAQCADAYERNGAPVGRHYTRIGVCLNHVITHIVDPQTYEDKLRTFFGQCLAD